MSTMTIFGEGIVVCPTNNWKKMHGIPMSSTKRYRHERKDMPKNVRITDDWSDLTEAIIY